MYFAKEKDLTNILENERVSSLLEMKEVFDQIMQDYEGLSEFLDQDMLVMKEDYNDADECITLSLVSHEYTGDKIYEDELYDDLRLKVSIVDRFLSEVSISYYDITKEGLVEAEEAFYEAANGLEDDEYGGDYNDYDDYDEFDDYDNYDAYDAYDEMGRIDDLESMDIDLGGGFYDDIPF